MNLQIEVPNVIYPISLTSHKQAYETAPDTLILDSGQVSNGGGERNFIIWAMKAESLGYKRLIAYVDPEIPEKVWKRLLGVAEEFNRTHKGFTWELTKGKLMLVC